MDLRFLRSRSRDGIRRGGGPEIDVCCGRYARSRVWLGVGVVGIAASGAVEEKLRQPNSVHSRLYRWDTSKNEKHKHNAYVLEMAYRTGTLVVPGQVSIITLLPTITVCPELWHVMLFWLSYKKYLDWQFRRRPTGRASRDLCFRRCLRRRDEVKIKRRCRR